MKAFLFAIITISIACLNQGCDNYRNQNEREFLSIKKELNTNDSLGSIIEKEILDKVLPGTEHMMTYINVQVNSDNSYLFNNQQLGQILNHFRANDSTIDKIINEGKSYPDQNKAKQIWNQVYNEYLKGDKAAFVKEHYKTGAMYHLNSVLINFNKSHAGNNLAKQYNGNPKTYELDAYSRKHAALSIIQMENAKKIQDKLKVNLQIKAKKLNEEGFNVSSEQVKKVQNIIMNEYVSTSYKSAQMLENSEKIDNLIAIQFGIKLKVSLINEMFMK